MSFYVVVTDGFKKHAKGIAKKHRSLKSDLDKLIDSLEENPTQGEPLGKECYKVRMAITSKGKGKSGGSRVITCVKIVNKTAYLLTIYDKSERQAKRLMKKFPSLKKEIQTLVAELKEETAKGTSIGHDCHKIRLAIASKGKGKSGGARVITHLIYKKDTVYLLTIFDKSDMENLSDKEILELIKLIP